LPPLSLPSPAWNMPMTSRSSLVKPVAVTPVGAFSSSGNRHRVLRWKQRLSCSPDSRRRTPNRAPHSAAGPFLCLRCLVRHQNLVRRQHRCGGTQYGRHCRPNRLKLLHLSNFGRRVQESPSIWSPECTVQRSPNQQLVTSEGLWAQLLILVWPPQSADRGRSVQIYCRPNGAVSADG
jgi:hypothetical protein